MEKFSLEDGVWRTVGGRRIFIKEGQDLATAMKESGKFPNKKTKVEEQTKKHIKKGQQEIEQKKEKKNSELTDEERRTKLEELEKKKQETQGFLQKGAIQEEIDMVKDGFDGTKEEYREYVSKEQERRLEEYKKEKEERLKQYQDKNEGKDDYRMAHRPTETGLTADNLLKEGNEVSAPKDIYEHPEYYSSGNKEWNQETLDQLKKARGNEDAEITIYRATTGDKINNGDWITLSKKYAEAHNESQLDGKGKVLEMKVKAKDIQFAGDMLEEWGYFPKTNGVKDAFEKYIKEHPNSKISLDYFEKNIYK